MDAISQTTFSIAFFFNENVWIRIKISLKFVPKGQINHIPALVQTMTRRRPGDKPLSEPMMVSLLTHICVFRPQWVNLKISTRTVVSVMATRVTYPIVLVSFLPGSNHYGIAGWYAMRALDHGMLVSIYSVVGLFYNDHPISMVVEERWSLTKGYINVIHSVSNMRRFAIFVWNFTGLCENIPKHIT